MDAELLDIARTPAEAGHLPGIEIERGDIVRRIFDCETRSATEADIFHGSGAMLGVWRPLATEVKA